MNTKKRFTKNTAKRMVRTFLQAVLGYIAANIAYVNITGERENLKSVLIYGLGLPAAAAGISAVMNLEENEEEEDEENE